jgi:hypothetical protein
VVEIATGVSFFLRLAAAYASPAPARYSSDDRFFMQLGSGVNFVAFEVFEIDDCMHLYGLCRLFCWNTSGHCHLLACLRETVLSLHSSRGNSVRTSDISIVFDRDRQYTSKDVRRKYFSCSEIGWITKSSHLFKFVVFPYVI